MSFLSGLTPSESLMKWREPNAYIRKNLSHGRWIGLLIVFMIAPGLPIAFRANHNFSKNQIVIISLFIVIGMLGFIVTWFGAGNAVCLKEDHISKLVGRSANRSRYGDIECCNVSHDNCYDTKFTVLKFSVRKGLPVGQIKEVAVPDDVNLEQVLHVLRDKGVKIVEAPLPS